MKALPLLVSTLVLATFVDFCRAQVGSVSAGMRHSLALKDNQTVWSWGQNAAGQLGDGTTTDRTAPLQIPALANVVAVSAGGDLQVDDQFSLALLADGRVMSWGGNAQGQLGNGTLTQQSSPGYVSLLDDVVAIEAGWDHSLALKSDGTVWAWGSNYYGSLGIGTAGGYRSTPQQVTGLTDVVEIQAGGSYSLARKSDGSLWAWGFNTYGRLGDGTSTNRPAPVRVADWNDVIGIAAGAATSHAVRADGSVWAWGFNEEGAIGDGTTATRIRPVPLPRLKGIVKVVTGYRSAFALAEDRTVWSWGQEGYGVRGEVEIIGSTLLPSRLTVPGDLESISVGQNHVLAYDSSGQVWSWGQTNSASGHIRPGPQDPSQAGRHDGVYYIDFALGTGRIFGIHESGKLSVSGGYNFYGGAGLGHRMPVPAFTDLKFMPATVPPGDRLLRTVSSQWNHTLAVDSLGQLWAWGHNSSSMVGGGLGSIVTMPTLVPSLTDVTSVATGSLHSMARIAAGSVYTWGSDTNGQLGLASSTTQGTPQPVSGIGTVASISAGQFHSVAVSGTGTVWTWGQSTNNKLGRTGDAGLPGVIPDFADVLKVEAGPNHNVALKNDGTVWSWGSHLYGQLGDGSMVGSSRVPLGASGLTGVVDVAVGKDCSYALKADGSVWAWGLNDQGQLGDGTTANRRTPVEVQGVRGVVRLAAANTAALALKEDGTFFAWGASSQGEIPGGFSLYQSKPSPVPGFNLFTDDLPSVDILTPLPGSTVLLGSSASFTVDAAAGDGPLEKVLYANRDLPLGQSAISPYSFSLFPESWGLLEVHARAMDIYGTLSDPSSSIGLQIPYDSDADTLPDWWEALHFGDLDEGPADDFDNDGVAHLDEYLLGKDPTRQGEEEIAADPDGYGQPASLATGLTGRWDFEELVSYGGTSHGFDDQSGAGRHATHATLGMDIDSEGLISKGALFDQTGDYLRVPGSLASGKSEFSLSLWARFEQDSVQSKANTFHTVLFAFNTVNDTYVEFAFTVYKSVPGSPTQKIIATRYLNGAPQAQLIGELPSGMVIDDGKWHHLALVKDGTSAEIFLDGGSLASGTVMAASWTIGATGYAIFGKDLATTTNTGTTFQGTMDRVRFYDRDLSSGEVLALFRQDSDDDGLWDITEHATRGVYRTSPYHWQPPDRDTDGDQLIDLDEQEAGTGLDTQDSDGDQLPDGWEVSHSLDPLDAGGVHGAAGDFDGDGVSNLDEYVYGADPTQADGDGDTVDDATEIAQGTDPSNPSDEGTPPDDSAYRQEVMFRVGGDYTKWRMSVRSTLGIEDTRRLRHSNPDFDTYPDRLFSLYPRNRYEITLDHVASGRRTIPRGTAGRPRSPAGPPPPRTCPPPMMTSWPCRAASGCWTTASASSLPTPIHKGSIRSPGAAPGSSPSSWKTTCPPPGWTPSPAPLPRPIRAIWRTSGSWPPSIRQTGRTRPASPFLSPSRRRCRSSPPMPPSLPPLPSCPPTILPKSIGPDPEP